jgi:hypothetical protein
MTTSRDSGFVSDELLMAVGILAILVLVGLGVSWLLGLSGRPALIAPGVLAAGLLAWIVGLNVVEAVRRRRRP